MSALILIAAVVAFVTGCGGGSKTASKAATKATQTTPSNTATQGSQTTPNQTASVTKPTIPAGAVAVVAGRPIALSTLNRWMFIAAKSSSAQTPGQPVIVPTHPPAFATCIAQLRKQVSQLANSSVAQLRAECGQLFTSLEGQAMDFLIKSHWYEAEAERLRITPTAAQVSQAYDAARRQQFPTGAGFERFLAQTGQTLPDVLFRFRINAVYSKLAARRTGSQTVRQATINRQVTQRFLPSTRCAPLYTMSDCGNYHHA